MKRSTVLVLLLCLTAAYAAGAAQSDGLPVLGIDDGASGLVSPSGAVRYVTLGAGADTLLARVRPRGGQVLSWILLHGRFTIPAVAYDGTPGGLSHDGRRLVLISPRTDFSRSRTTFVLLGTERGLLRRLRTIDLKGDFSFDALSPQGRVAYLIQYTSPTDPNVYLVRAFDLQTGRLLAKAVTDHRERAGTMRGRPLTRIASPDGRWAYTLYDGGGGAPFVHALDTASATAHCVDLPRRYTNVLWQLHFRLDPVSHTLTLVNGVVPVAAIDARTLEVHAPAAVVAAPSRPNSGIPWLLIALATVGAVAVVGASVLVLRRRGAAVTPSTRNPARAS